MSIPAKKPVNYLNNKDILKEIHQSKNSYCSYSKPEYHQYDFIIDQEDNSSLEKNLEYTCKDEIIQQARESRANREKIDVESVQKTDLVFRVMTWDHIPVAPKQPRKTVKSKSAKEIFDFENESELDDLEDPELAKEMGMDNMVHIRVNFPPFQHFKFDNNNNLVCVGKSHWKNDVNLGEFSKDHGQFTPKLAKMYLMLCEKYAMRYNWRGYCVDSETQALTDRGWLDYNQITESDKILSYDSGKMRWSKIKSIYRGEFNGLMHEISNSEFESLITPEHKLVTDSELKKIENINDDDNIVLMGNDMSDESELTNIENKTWLIEILCHYLRNGNRITNTQLGIDIVNSLTSTQRRSILSAITNSELDDNKDFIYSCDNITLTKIDMIQMLCALSGVRSCHDKINNKLEIFNSSKNVVKFKDITRTKTNYIGTVWCPETEYGSFVARKTGSVFLTGNTYNDEMRGAAILQLTYVGLRFNESKSQNPFAYYTAAINNSFRRVLNTEKRNQNLRDDILEMNNLSPSWSRQNSGDGGHYDE